MLFLVLFWDQANPPSADYSAKKGLRAGAANALTLHPPQDTVDDARIRIINDLSLQLKNRDPKQVKTICQRRHQLNSRWNSFHGNLLRYQQQLEGALEIHALSQKLGDITELIREKATLVQTLDYGKDLEGVQRLMRKHEQVEQEMGLIQEQVEPLEREVGRLCQRSPGAAHSLSLKQQEMPGKFVSPTNSPLCPPAPRAPAIPVVPARSCPSPAPAM